MRKLKLLMVACAMFGVCATSWGEVAFTYQKYLIKNVGSGLYWGASNSWGTQASLVPSAAYLKLVPQDDGTYYIESQVNNGGTSYYFNGSYMDNDSPVKLTITEVSPGVYTIANGDVFYGYDGTSTVLGSSADGTSENFQWTIVSLDDAKTALADATADSPMDATFLIEDHNFGRNNRYFNKWTVTSGGGDAKKAGDNENMNWQQWNATCDISQTIALLPNGIYSLKAQGFYRPGGNDTESTAQNATLYAGTKSVAIALVSSTHATEANAANGLTTKNTNEGSEYYVPNSQSDASKAFTAGLYENELTDIIVTDGTLTLGVKNEGTVGNQWLVIDNFRLTYYGADLTILKTAYDNAVAAAENFDLSQKMGAEEKEALEIAKEKYTSGVSENETSLKEATNALNAAVSNATASVAAYEGASKYFAKMKAVLDNTNVYTEDAYNANYGTWLAAYEDNTLTTAQAANLTESSAYSTGWHSSNFIDDILLSTWSIGGEQAKDYTKALYINTWSNEGASDGSEFLAPFFEYWTGDANSLGANTIQTKIYNLTPEGKYSLTIRARVRQADNKEKIENGITMQVGEGTPVDISSGAQFNGGQFFIGNFSAVGKADDKGTLTATITVAENSNISWLSFYNAKYTEGEDLSAYVADYEFALGNVNKAIEEDVIYASMQDGLKAALDEYGSADTSSKDALIAGKEGLETALAAYNEQVAPLKCNNISKWTTTGNNGNFEVNTWSGEGSTDGSNLLTPFAQNWKGKGTNLTDATMSYTIEGLSPGYYKVSALIRTLNEAGDATPAGSFIFANDAIERAYNGTACTNGVYDNPVVYGLVGSDGKLTIGVKIIKANVNWVSWKNFVYEFVGTDLTSDIAQNLTEEARIFEHTTTGAAAEQADAINALAILTNDNYTAAGKAIEAAYKASDFDFSALQTAYDAMTIPTLGFESGEYAPYTNAGNFAILQNAKDMLEKQNATTQAEIDEMKTSVEGLSWTANSSEVNAIYWTTYGEDAAKDAGGRIFATGWGLEGGTDAYNVRIQNDVTNNPGLAAVENNTAVFGKFDMTYGETTGYTMPLKANKIYKLSFKYGGWNEPSNTTVKMIAPDESELVIDAAMIVPGGSQYGHSDVNNWWEWTGYFVAPTTGNYVLKFKNNENGQHQKVIGNMSLFSAENLLFGETLLKYAPGTYPSVKISREFSSSNWATAVYPFAVSASNIAVLDSYDSEKGVLAFKTASTSTPNVPFLLKNDGAITLKDVAVAAAAATDATAGIASLKGVYASTEVDNSAINYVLKDKKIYKVGESAATVNPYRAYIQLAQASEARELTFTVDGEATGISEVKARNNANGDIYNLNGQRVKNAKKGVFIMNGKTVIVK